MMTMMTRLRAIVLILTAALTIHLRAGALPQDKGAAGTWQKLLKLRTTASAMHTTAHPDDEHGGVLALLSRGQGARVSLLTLNRGESGDNAIGSELFDGLGLIRTEELLVADRYYGVDDQYFTTVIDYGFSKRLDEALEKWGRENVLRDVVRVIRMNRPYVLISRFQGNERDGHGNHQTAGLITQEAFSAAGNPKVFPEQIAEGLWAWQPLKLYMGGVRENEPWSIRVDTGEYSPALGDSYQNFSRLGLSFQRSQTSGRMNTQPGPFLSYYKRLASVVAAPDRESSFFDGIDTSLAGLFGVLDRPAPSGAADLLSSIDREVANTIQGFKMSNPSASVPPLARGLKATREAMARVAAEPEAVFILKIKERQFMDAINTSLGIELSAVAQPPGTVEPGGPFAAFAPPAVMGPVVPGQRFEVRAALTNRGRADVSAVDISLIHPLEWTTRAAEGTLPPTVKYNETASRHFTVTVPDEASPARPYLSRTSIAESRYTVADQKQRHRPAAAPTLVAIARYLVEGVPGEILQPVERREAQLPYGYVTRELVVVPHVAVNVRPRLAIVPLAMSNKRVALEVGLVNNIESRHTGTLGLSLPAGWKSEPARIPFSFTRAGEKSFHRFDVSMPTLENRDYRIDAIASAGGRDFRDGYDLIVHRDLESRYLYREAASRIRGIDVKIAPGLAVGYVMGVGDEVPAAIAQLGARVQLLSEADLASGNLQPFDAIMTGTRAYAVREDLRTYNQRLLDYVDKGGNLIVLYNTQEFVPARHAPFPADLPARAEEVSEEDAPVDILARDHPVFHVPNEITRADFDGWIEQRGSKFFAAWDRAYTPMIETHDRSQAPQQGGWLWARHGKGHYTYFAYAFHRQLPYGVPGAYRLLANLLSLGKGR